MNSLGRTVRSLVLGLVSLVWLGLATLACGFPAIAQPQQSPAPQSSGSISGTVVDPSGAVIVGAQVKLTRGDQTPSRDVLTDNNGQFSFANIALGPFHLTVTEARFAAQTFSGTLHSAEVFLVPPIKLAIGTDVQEMRVTPSTQAEVAEEQIKEQEKQRVIGFIPNFYVSYIPDAAPLDTKQKFELFWKTTVDPITFGLTAAAAGIEQADNQYSGYGQGAEGYGKRYGAAYADAVTSSLIGDAILPSLLKQDPRYFYKGTGSARSRLLYAISRSVICRGDNERSQANYSYIFGDLAASGISNAYYPANDRGAGLTFENAAIGIGATAAANVIQEFVVRKLTPNASRPAPATP